MTTIEAIRMKKLMIAMLVLITRPDVHPGLLLSYSGSVCISSWLLERFWSKLSACVVDQLASYIIAVMMSLN